MSSALYSCPVLMKLEFYRHFFEKYSNIEFHENPSSGSQIVPCGQADVRTGGGRDRRTDGMTDRHTEASSRCSQFCKHG